MKKKAELAAEASAQNLSDGVLQFVQKPAKRRHRAVTTAVRETREMPTGKVKFYNDEKGFGFIEQSDGAGDLFFHISVVAGNDDPEKGQKVEFDIGKDTRDNRPRAENVKLIS